MSSRNTLYISILKLVPEKYRHLGKVSEDFMEENGFVRVWGNVPEDKWHVVLATASVYAAMDDLGDIIRKAHPEYDMSSWGMRGGYHGMSRIAFGNDWEYEFTEDEIKSAAKEHVMDDVYALSEREYSVDLPYTDWGWLDQFLGRRLDMRVIKSLEQEQKSRMLAYEDETLHGIIDDHKYTEASINLGQILTAAYLYAKRHKCAAFAYLGE